MDIVVPGAANLTLFVGAALALLLVPGPAVLYIVGRSMEQGRVAGLVSMAGIHAATMVHIAAAALGLSALLASSSFAVDLVKYAGAAYLIWLGLRKIFAGEAAEAPTVRTRRYRRMFRDGFIVNLLNPKTAIFFFAFLPQFVEVGRGHVAMQIAVLGLILASLGVITDGAYALAAGAFGNWLRKSRGFARFERYFGGLLMIGLGITAAVAGQRK